MAGVIITAVCAGCGSIAKIVPTINQVKERWITPSREYQQQADILRGRLDTYKEQVSFGEQPVDGPLMTTLKRAKSRLKRAEDRLPKSNDSVSGNQCCSCCSWLYAKVCLTLFPENVQEILNEVEQDLASIPDILQKELELSNRLREASKNEAISTTIRDNDSKYVPIAKSQEEVIKAIEDSHGRLMILLYGGFGKGKSTLARYICHRYGKFGEKSNLFDHVIFVSCGNSSVSTKQYEILKHLSPESSTEEDSKSGSGKSKIDSGFKIRNERALEKFLIRKKVLIILDDVRDPSFLYEMWKVAKSGKDGTILITSQKFNLCDNLKGDSKVIQMETPTLVEARKILASLVGLERKEIPAGLQAIADDVIEATDRNPLAFSCWAGSFACNKNKESKREWQDAWRPLSKALHNKDMAIVLGCNDEFPPRSLYQTVKACIDSLDTKYHAKCILFLMYAIKGESVPEEVLRILWAGMEMPSSTIFNRARGELCMSELLKPTGHSLAPKIFGSLEQNDDDLLEARSWSLHSVVKLYMQEAQIVGKGDIRGTIGALLGDEDFPPQSNIEYEQDNETEIVEIGKSKEMTEEIRVVIVLCALYFDRGHTDQVVSRAVTRATKISDLEDSDNTINDLPDSCRSFWRGLGFHTDAYAINDLRRIAIEPLIWLLDKPEEPKEQWTKSNSCRVRKVVLKYICKRQLDNENISYLVNFAACPSAQRAILMSLARITTIEDGIWLNENAIIVRKFFVDLLINNGIQGMEEAAARVVVPTTRQRPPRNCLSSHDTADSEVPSAAASALTNLAISAEPKLRIAKQEGALVELVKCLSKEDKPDLQILAGTALANLSSSEELKLSVANQEGALTALVNCLSKEGKPGLQFVAVRALGQLASSLELKLRIAIQEGALLGLMTCLSNNDKPALLEAAASALADLAGSASEEVRLGIANQEGALPALANCLSKDDKPDLQEVAVRALADLAFSDELTLRIGKQEGVLVGLVNCLSKDDKPDLLEVAATALANLSGGSDFEEVRLGITKQEGALVGLVNCLSKDDKADLLKAAATALANLAGSDSEEVRLGIAKQEGALAALVNCLSKEDKPDLQEVAVGALAT